MERFELSINTIFTNDESNCRSDGHSQTGSIVKHTLSHEEGDRY